MDNPLPDRMESIRTIRRITSSPGSSTEKRPKGDERHGTHSKRGGSFKTRERQETPPMRLPGGIAADGDWIKGHKRGSSDDLRSMWSVCVTAGGGRVEMGMGGVELVRYEI